jgi:hypothetical protein
MDPMKAKLAIHRLVPQRLVGEPLESPAAAVGHLGAVQSQLHDMSLWAVGRRCGASLAEVTAAFERGDFVRTHVLRPTWHHVLPGDLMDLLELTAPRIRQLMSSNNRRDGLTPESIRVQAGLAIDAIRSTGPLTRPEVETLLTEAGFTRQGNSMAHVMIEAELSGLIHSGPVRGKQHTYIAADLPHSGRSPDERLAWIAITYGRGHGPFRAKDLAWWTSLTLTQARRAIELADLEPIELAGEPHHLVEPLTDVEVPSVLLLPAFDEYISYARDPDDYALVNGEVGIAMRAGGLLFIGGALAGLWTRAISASDVRVTVESKVPLSPGLRAEIDAEACRFGAFVERAVDVHFK